MPDPETENDTAMDDWAAAMAEQESSTPAEEQATSVSTQNNATVFGTKSAPVFEQLSKNEVLTGARNDIDMILDIPVQLTVELGRTKIAIKNLLQLDRKSVV